VIPKDVKAYTRKGNPVELNPVWKRRHCTKFNGVSYITQRGAEAVYSLEGKKQNQSIIDLYMSNADTMCQSLKRLGYQVYGGHHAPYLWLETPKG